ncbi:MAG: hypothetical protein JO149_00770, partial [Gammaproteobacteria bacterium]|nr:hypothetical protein [Gammaproteobacteria bacterium]
MELDTAIIHESTLRSSTIKISGYKHCTTVIMAASVLIPETEISLSNLPNIDDVKYMKNILDDLGGETTQSEDVITIASKKLSKFRVPEQYSQHIHGAIYFLPVLLGRFQQVEMGNCGGCALGNYSIGGRRPLEHMLSVLKKFGASFYQQDEKMIGTTEGFHACTIDIRDYSEQKDILTGPLVSGATKTAILAAAAVQHGKTIIFYPYPKPDVMELLKFLQACGYGISYGKNFVEISPPKEKAKQVAYHLMSDISQIMTYITLSVYCKTPLTLTHITTAQVKAGLKAEFNYFKKMGIHLNFTNNTISIAKVKNISALNIEVTSIGIYSDHQPFFA